MDFAFYCTTSSRRGGGQGGATEPNPPRRQQNRKTFLPLINNAFLIQASAALFNKGEETYGRRAIWGTGWWVGVGWQHLSHRRARTTDQRGADGRSGGRKSGKNRKKKWRIGPLPDRASPRGQHGNSFDWEPVALRESDCRRKACVHARTHTT